MSLYVLYSFIILFRDGIYGMSFALFGFKVYILDIITAVCFLWSVITFRATDDFSASMVIRKSSLFGLFFLLVFVDSIVLGNSPVNVFGQMRIMMFPLLYYISVFFLVRSYEDVARFIRFLEYGIFVIIGIVVYRLVSGNSYDAEYFLEVADVDTVERFMSLTEAGVLLIYYTYELQLLQSRQRIGKASVVRILLVLFCFLVSNYRSVWFSAFIVTLIVGLTYVGREKHWKFRIKKLVPGVVGVLAAGWLINQFYGSVIEQKLFSENLDAATASRLFVWWTNLQLLQGYHLFVGQGVGFEGYLFDWYKSMHNDPLQLLRDLGIVGVILYVLAFKNLVDFKGNESLIDEPGIRAFYRSVPYSILSFLLISLFEPFFVQLIPMCMTFSLLGIYAKLKVLASTSRPIPAVSLQRE